MGSYNYSRRADLREHLYQLEQKGKVKMKKSGANSEDIRAIRVLAEKNYTAEKISNVLNIELSVVLSFMSGGNNVDVDRDGMADNELYNADGIVVTEDADSVNIDVDGDGEADIIIKK